MKAWRVRLAGYVERMGEKRNVYMGFFGPGGGVEGEWKPDVKRP